MVTEPSGINIDKDNAVELIELKIQLEAVEDKIIVVIDAYKSGYECSTCGGTGKVKSTVVEGVERDCDACRGKGTLLVIPEVSKSLPTLGTVVSVGEKTRWQRYLKDVWYENRNLHSEVYSEEEWKEHKKRRQEELDKERDTIKIRPGAKVLFQPHVGTLIPFKGNIRLKAMREHEPLVAIYGSHVDSKDFMDFDVPLEERY